MSKTNYPGIDYSLGQSNFDKENGIHFGVICIHDLNEWAHESFEADYGKPHCPECGNKAVKYDNDKHSDYDLADVHCCDFACESCEAVLEDDQVYGDEPAGWTLDDGEYKGFLDEHNDVMLLKSPYKTRCAFCSPCAPGAGHLACPCDSGVWTYCFDKSWFEGDKAPYSVYWVDTGELVD